MLVGRLKRGETEQSMIIRGLRGVGKSVALATLLSAVGGLLRRRK